MIVRAPRPLLASIAAALVLAAAGCGGDDENDKFVDEANNLCKEAEDRIGAAAGDNDKIVAEAQRFISDIKAVDAPEDKQADYDAWVKTQEDYFEELKAAIEAGDQKAIDALDANQGDDQARDLGLDNCVG